MCIRDRGTKINILDTPGHEDFAEDTYRTLTAVDSVIIVIDGAKGCLLYTSCTERADLLAFAASDATRLAGLHHHGALVLRHARHVPCVNLYNLHSCKRLNLWFEIMTSFFAPQRYKIIVN